tara:strand:+ start:1097 stop:1336 length:240 start_codon:yes stop_codon:yes gene_type:complete
MNLFRAILSIGAIFAFFEFGKEVVLPKLTKYSNSKIYNELRFYDNMIRAKEKKKYWQPKNNNSVDKFFKKHSELLKNHQ